MSTEPCPVCLGSEWVCENDSKPWNLPGGCDCSPGVPCPACSPIGAPLTGPLGTPALEPADLPNQPLTAAKAAPFIEKEIG